MDSPRLHAYYASRILRRIDAEVNTVDCKSISVSVAGSTLQLRGVKNKHPIRNAKALKDESLDHPEKHQYYSVARRKGAPSYYSIILSTDPLTECRRNEGTIVYNGTASHRNRTRSEGWIIAKHESDVVKTNSCALN